MAQTRFNFIGTVLYPKTDAKRPFIKEFLRNNRKMLSLNFGIKESDNNMAYVEAFDSEQDKIITINSDNEKIEISWNDRFDEEIVNAVASYKKTTVDLGEDLGGRKEFITMFDAIGYIQENLPKYKGKICVTGQVVKEFYQNRYYDKFKIQNIYAVDDDKKNRLAITADIYYNKSSVDKTDYKEEKKIYIDGFIQQYINKDEGNKYIPQRFVFNANKYDINNEKHKALLDYKLKYIDITNKTMQHLTWDIVLLNGAETIEFDESQLTKSQKEQIELGIRTLDDFKPKGLILGNRVNEYRLFDPKLTGDFSDGLIDTEMKESEFEELIYVPAVDEKIENGFEKTNTEKATVTASTTEDVSDDDLF
jgi:hypothetical protein